MNELKIIVVGNEMVDILGNQPDEKFKNTEFWQITSDEDLEVPKYFRKILSKENSKTNILNTMLWRANKVVFIILPNNSIQFDFISAIEIAQESDIDFSIFIVKPFLFECRARIYKEICEKIRKYTNDVKIINQEEIMISKNTTIQKCFELRDEVIKTSLSNFFS